MIYTITCNPALDCTVRLDTLRQGEINFTHGCTLTPGGKGINVSRILTALEVENTALGFVAGGNGALLEGALEKMGLVTAFTPLEEGQTRINVKLYGDTETQLNAPGPVVSLEDLERVKEQLYSLALTPADTVCLCGSLAPGMLANSYRRLVKQLHGMGVRYTVVDTTGEALLEALQERPWLIKPNREELAALVGRNLPTLTDVIAAAEDLMEQGAQNVLVSLGGDGAVLCAADGRRLYQPAPHGHVIGTVGAGDSLVAGFVAGWRRTEAAQEALRLGVACGSATAYTEGLATAPEIAAALDCLPEMTEI